MFPIEIVSHFSRLVSLSFRLFGNVKGVFCLGGTHIPERIDEEGNPYKCTADDAAYATFELFYISFTYNK